MSAEGRLGNADKPATARVFFALWPPAEVADRLAQIANDSAAHFGGRATRRNTIHLTLAFLGEVPESRLPELCALADGVSGRSFPIVLDLLGYWPHKHLLWAGSRAPVAPLGELVSSLRDALRRGGFAFDAEQKEFVPHVTLVRKIPVAGGLRDSGRSLLLESLDWPVDRFFLIRSRLTPSGSEYLILRDFSLS